MVSTFLHDKLVSTTLVSSPPTSLSNFADKMCPPPPSFADNLHKPRSTSPPRHLTQKSQQSAVAMSSSSLRRHYKLYPLHCTLECRRDISLSAKLTLLSLALPKVPPITPTSQICPLKQPANASSHKRGGLGSAAAAAVEAKAAGFPALLPPGTPLALPATPPIPFLVFCAAASELPDL